MRKHRHHIIPKHAGGSNAPSNIIELTIDEHADAHKLLWEQHGRWQDYYAWQLLSHKMTKENFMNLMKDKNVEHCRSISHLGGKCNKNKKMCYNPNTGEQTKYIDKIPDGFVKGRSPETFDKNKIVQYSHDASGSLWCHDPNNASHSKMIASLHHLPDGWCIGRGSAHITESNKTATYRWWTNPKTGERTTSKTCPGDDWILGSKNRKKPNINVEHKRAVMLGRRWYFNTLNTKERRMFKPTDDIPDGWKLGRGK